MSVFDYNEINALSLGNIVQYKGSVYSIYDMDESLVYLSNIDLRNIGIPVSEIRPVLVTDHVMDACEFEIYDEPEKIFVGDDLVQLRTTYVLKKNDYDIDFKITIIVDYNTDNDDPLLVRTFDKIDKNDTKVKYLHQIQNIFMHFYKFDLIRLE